MPNWTQEQLEAFEVRKRHNALMGQRKTYAEANRVPQAPEPQRSASHEPVAAPEGKTADTTRRLIRVKSFRTHLCDERNLCDKYFVDSLVYAGCLLSDAPEHAQVIVSQEQVDNPALERTEITVESCS